MWINQLSLTSGESSDFVFVNCSGLCSTGELKIVINVHAESSKTKFSQGHYFRIFTGVSAKCYPDHCFKDWSFRTATTAAVEGKMGKGLKKLLKKVFASGAHDTLAVADSKLGNLIKASS